jgi:ABC-type Mn2+/Zn2+ transport system permease subunit
MFDALLDPWSHAFLQRAMLELVLLGVTGGVLGCWIVLYELSYSAESLAHALLPGLVTAALLGLPLLVGGVAGVAVAAVAIALVARVPAIGRDAAVGIAITSLFALGVLLALSPNSPRGLSTLLFGDLLGVTTADLVAAAVVGAAVVGALGALHRPLLALGFDRGSAGSLGLRATPIELALLGLVAAAVVVGVQALGNLLVVAVVVAPAATARLLTRRVLPMMAASVLVAVACAAGGLYLSYYANTAGGASVAAVLVCVYALAVLTRRGFVRRRRAPAGAGAS